MKDTDIFSRHSSGRLLRIIENANLDGQRHAYWTALTKMTSSTFAETVDWLNQQIKDNPPVKDATGSEEE